MSVYQTFQHSRDHIAFSAPHYSAAQVGISLLEQGATAIEATIAAAASLTVVYPHMTGLGGDGLWLISEPNKSPRVIDACGRSGRNASAKPFVERHAIPARGGIAAITMAGAVGGWQKALEINRQWQGKQPVSALFNHAIGQARWGFEVSQSLSDATQRVFTEQNAQIDFANYTSITHPLNKGDIIKLPKLANTYQRLCDKGLDDFYRGEIGAQVSQTLQNAGSCLVFEDFHQYHAQITRPISVDLSGGRIFNVGAPTQGFATLLILAIYDHLQQYVHSEADFVHLVIEATKQAFIIRNQYLCDADFSSVNIEQFLHHEQVVKLAKNIDMQQAQPWALNAQHGDTVWTGAIDNQGRMVSYIQSLYWEFGCALECPETGIVWNNRGQSFSLSPHAANSLAAGKKPLHTLNPSYAELKNGSRISFGTMGGDGQPQIQAAVFIRYVYQGLSLQGSINKGRWLLGRNWGSLHSGLAIEADLAAEISEQLLARGHDLTVVEACNELMGHAGLVELTAKMDTNAGFDPRSDGRAFSSMGTL